MVKDLYIRETLPHVWPNTWLIKVPKKGLWYQMKWTIVHIAKLISDTGMKDSWNR